MSGSLITLKHIQLQLHSDSGPVQVLRGIDLDIKRGETLGVVGPSGSGKTSLLMVIAGLEPATGGSLISVGHDLGALGEDDLARYRRDHVAAGCQESSGVRTRKAAERGRIPREYAGQGGAVGSAER